MLDGVSTASGPLADAGDAILDALDEGVAVLDPELTVAHANRRARELLSIEPGESLPDHDAALELSAFAASALRSGSRESLVLRPHTAPLRVTGRRLPHGLLLVVHEIGERERDLELTARRSSRAALELGRALAGIAGALEALEHGSELQPEERHRFVTGALRAAARAAGLIDALVVFDEIEHDCDCVYEQLEVEPLLHRAAEILEPRPGVVVAVECEPDVPDVSGSGTLVAAALTALGDAATRAATGGRVTLRGRRVNGNLVALEVCCGDALGPSPSPDELPFIREVASALGGAVHIETAAQRVLSMRLILRRHRGWEDGR